MESMGQSIQHSLQLLFGDNREFRQDCAGQAVHTTRRDQKQKRRPGLIQGLNAREGEVKEQGLATGVGDRIGEAKSGWRRRRRMREVKEQQGGVAGGSALVHLELPGRHGEVSRYQHKGSLNSLNDRCPFPLGYWISPVISNTGQMFFGKRCLAGLSRGWFTGFERGCGAPANRQIAMLTNLVSARGEGGGEGEDEERHEGLKLNNHSGDDQFQTRICSQVEHGDAARALGHCQHCERDCCIGLHCFHCIKRIA
eukprot:755463-Hanusia_phi.AAC.6